VAFLFLFLAQQGAKPGEISPSSPVDREVCSVLGRPPVQTLAGCCGAKDRVKPGGGGGLQRSAQGAETSHLPPVRTWF